MEVNINKANNCRYNPATFMVLGGTMPPPHILGPTLYCIFSAVNTVIGLCLAMKSVDLWRNLCAIILYFIVHVPCRCKERSRSLSQLLMSFLLFEIGLSVLLGLCCCQNHFFATSLFAELYVADFLYL